MKHQKSCMQWQELLAVSYPEEDLSPSEYTALEKHIAECTDCAALREQYRAMTTYFHARSAVQSLPSSMPRYPRLQLEVAQREDIEPVEQPFRLEPRYLTSSRSFTYVISNGLALISVLGIILASLLLFLPRHGSGGAKDVLHCDSMIHTDAELTAGVQNVVPGQTLCLVPGIYTVRFGPGAIVIPSGTASQPVTITGYDPTTGGLPDAAHRPVIRPQIQGIQDVLLLQGAHDIRIDSLFLDGSSDGTPHKAAHAIVKLSDSTNIIIKNSELAWGLSGGLQTAGQSDQNQFLNLRVHNNGTDANGAGISIETSSNIVDHCEVYNNTGIGIQLYTESLDIHVTHNIIRNSLVHHNGTGPRKESGILVLSAPPAPLGNVANNEIYNNIVYDNSYGGIWIGGTSGTPGGAIDTKVYNNTVFHNRGDGEVHGIYIDPNSISIDTQNNISYHNEAGDYSDNVDVTRNWPTGSVPPFVDITNPEAPDLHLTSHTSPQGAHLALVTSDANGGCRPSGTYDMGAYEFGSIPNKCATWSKSH